VPVNVLDAETYHSLPFQPERLHASVAGHPVTLSNLEKITGNRILLLIDISGSMGRASLRELSDLVLDKLPPESTFAYGFFTEGLLLSDGFSDAKEFRKELQQLPPLQVTGYTALYDALDQALKLFRQHLPGDSILLISDGGENRSKIHVSTLRKEVIESGVRFFAIIPVAVVVHIPPEGAANVPTPGFSPSPPSNPVEETAEQFLSDLAEKTGGSVYKLSQSDLRWSVKQWRAPVLQAIQRFWLEGVGGGYQATIQLPGKITKPVTLNLRLDTSREKALQNGFLTYRQKLMPCSSAAAAVH